MITSILIATRTVRSFLTGLGILACSLWFISYAAPVAHAAGRVFYDGFESGNTNQWGQDGSHAKCPVVTSANGVPPYAGSYFASCNNAKGSGTEVYDSLTIPTSNYTNELFIRVKIRIDADYDDTGGSPSKLLRIFYWDGNQATYKDAFSIYYGAGGLGFACNSGNSYCEGGQYSSLPGDSTANSGAWHEVEMYFNSATGAVKVWHDGGLAWDKVVNTTSNKWTPFYITSNWSDPHDDSNHVYFDDFEVYSDTGSGATGSLSAGTITQGGADTTPPSPPSGLAVQ